LMEGTRRSPAGDDRGNRMQPDSVLAADEQVGLPPGALATEVADFADGRRHTARRGCS
jgi:hypothetical protein